MVNVTACYPITLFPCGTATGFSRLAKRNPVLPTRKLKPEPNIFCSILPGLGARRLVEPTVVMEVAFNNIQKSQRHESGYALRFPRILRLRPDKPVAEIDTLDRVAQLYSRQITLPRYNS